MSEKDYDLDSMRKAIAKCDANIVIFEEAIRKEMTTKMEYQRIIRTLQERASRSPPVISVEVVRVDKEDDGEEV